MKPIGPLMREHRLIERLIDLLESEKERIEGDGSVDRDFLKDAVDFFRTYADRTHHGKEEEILFRKLEEKDLSDEHKTILNQLLNEHREAREKVTRLHRVIREVGEEGDGPSGEISKILGELISSYRNHIDKEDNRFFRPSMDYFPESEQDEMLRSFYEFDREMIHERYRRLAEHYEESG